ncbi:fibrillin-1-like [Melitaea cinxia]|uniref:fibrillin-1-like n=1 Tax=Melitaea cinxia TaxID=113334 RepID=UPI001E27237E|nr:fibrillin-1-like [Melitaea cinxia]
MWYFVLCLFILPMPYVDGSLADEMAETTQLCCNQGTAYAQNHTVEDCSSSVPPPVPASFDSLCIFAMDQCCKEYFTKKIDCENGIDVAKSLKSCGSTKDSAKKCCDQCKSGAIIGKARGAASCSVSVHGKSAEQLLAGEAFSQCCKDAVKDSSNSQDKHRDSVSQPKPTEKDLSMIASKCEEYAPNELCAHHCIPVPGSYKCECNPGFMLMHDGKNCKEVTKNRCKPHNPCHHKCNDNGIEVKCSCRRGYQLMADKKSCEGSVLVLDIDECALDPPLCLPDTQCFNIQGSYKCIPVKNPKSSHEIGQCPPGFAKNFLNNACDDINECKLPTPPCPSYLCQNTIGGYKCGGLTGDPLKFFSKQKPHVEDRCPPGFKSGLSEECEDIDECLMGKDDCNNMSQFCINTRGSFHCQDKGSKHCPPGFKNNAITNKCEDIDECEDGQDICRPDQICVNVLGEYDCKPKIDPRNTKIKCPEGMRWDPAMKQCDDIDECVEGTHLCDQYQNCLNTNGSHECHCKLGFELDSTLGACVDINECATDQNNCIPDSQRCDNTVGSFLCIRLLSCGTGYIIHHSSSTCEDIDECALGTHNCDRAGPEYQCVNIPGSFRCQRRHTPTPVYDYEYYDSEEEIDEKDISQNNSKSENVTTTTPNPTTIEVKTVSIPQPTEPTPEEPIVIPIPEKPADPFDNSIINEPEQSKPTQQIPEDRKIFNSIQPPGEPNSLPQPQEPEYKPIEPDYKPIEPEYKPIEPEYKPIEPEYKPIEPESQPTEPTKPETKPTEPEYKPEVYPKTPETTNSPIPEEPTPPIVITVSVTEETATVKGHKNYDGSVVVDTNKVQKDKWTVINQKPTDCQAGFEMDDYGACFDIDECATNRHSCSGLTESCRNTMGGYMCNCAIGFRRDLPTGACIPTTSSSSTTSTSTSTSTSTTTSTSTSTTSTTTPTPPTSSSTKDYFWGYPDPRSMTSRPFRPRNNCDVGYRWNPNNRKCEDVNECTNGQANCATGEVCINTDGGYRCECLPNWRLDLDRHRCMPVWDGERFPPGYKNLPVYPKFDANAIIPETKGTVNVTIAEDKHNEDRRTKRRCPLGYRLSRDDTCEDIDECTTGEAQCGPLQQCTNLRGGYTCSCPLGLRLVGDHQCEDIDECSLSGPPVCSQHADCLNTMGSYQCHCHKGFKSAPINDKVCVDVDECLEARAGTLCEQRCNNVWGAFRCSCHRGYRLNADNRTCSDVDECTEFKHKKLCIGRCLNEPGSYRCSCPPGYRLAEDNRSCVDIDECETGAAPCAGGAPAAGASDVCLNTRGGYRCHRIACPPGYRLESKHLGFHEVELFTMRGPAWRLARMRFQLRVVSVDAPPSVAEPADISAFSLVQTGNQAVTSLVRPLIGPQSIELELSMELYSGEQFGGIAVAKLFIYVSEYEF